jgi:hypothetical protein
MAPANALRSELAKGTINICLMPMSALLGRITPLTQLAQTGNALAGKEATTTLASDPALAWKGRIK